MGEVICVSLQISMKTQDLGLRDARSGNKRGSTLRLVWFALLLAVGIPCALAQDTLQPSVQKPFERGIAAAQAGEFALAITNFDEARSKAPLHPALLFNLGLAHGKAGHELAAIAWLHAYLAADPAAANAPAVRTEIERLKEVTRAKQKKLFDFAISQARTLAGLTDSERDGALSAIAQHQARIFDLPAAEQTLALRRTPDSYNSSSSLKEWSALELARRGQVDRARQLLTEVTPPKRRDSTLLAIAEYFLDKGDLAASRAAADQIEDRPSAKPQLIERIRMASLKRLIESGLERGDLDMAALAEYVPLGVKNFGLSYLDQLSRRLIAAGNLAAARELAHKQPDGSSRVRALDELERAYTKVKDRAGANAARAEVSAQLDTMAFKSDLQSLYSLMSLQLERCDLRGAKSTAGRMVRLTPKDGLEIQAIAMAQALMANHEWGMKAAARATNAWFNPTAKDGILAGMALVQAIHGDDTRIGKTADYAVKINDYPVDSIFGKNHSRSYVFQFAARGYTFRGDLIKATESLERMASSSLGVEGSIESIGTKCLDQGDLHLALRCAVVAARFGGLSSQFVASLRPALDKRLAPAKADRVLNDGLDALFTSTLIHAPAMAPEVAALRKRATSYTTGISARLAKWLDLAVKYSQDEAIIKLEKAISNPSQGTWSMHTGEKGGDLLARIAEIAAKLGGFLMGVEILEQQPSPNP